VKLVVDTNVLISGSLWHGPSARLISVAFGGGAQIFLSLSMLLEFRETLQQEKFGQRLVGRNETPDSLMIRLQTSCHEAIPTAIMPPAQLRDRDDLHVLACALAAEADAIVTGDKDLLTMKAYEGIPILTVQQALEKLGVSER
jgi:putative PIN family toxin of toxin-antitoxin system